jgi:hypothetical protein
MPRLRPVCHPARAELAGFPPLRNVDAGEGRAQQRPAFLETGGLALGIGEWPPRQLPEANLRVHLEDPLLKLRHHRIINLADFRANSECLATDCFAAILT